MMDDSVQTGEKCFGIKCVAEKQKEQKQKVSVYPNVV